jgi:hypothetical protein
MRIFLGVAMAILLTAAALVVPLHAWDSEFLILDSYWGAVGSPAEVLAGDVAAPLVVSVRYLGDQPITNPSMTITLPLGFRNSTGGATAISSCQGTIPYGGRMDFLFRVSVDSGATAGSYLCDASIEYARYSTRYDTTSKQYVSEYEGVWRQSLAVPISLYEGAILDMTVSPSYIVAGRTANITLRLVNAGKVDVRNVELTVSLGAGLAMVGADNKIHIGQIVGGESSSLNLTLFAASALAGTMVQMNIAISYRTAYGFAKSETRAITMPVRGFTEAQVVNAVAPASSTSKFTVTGTVANTGLVPLRTLVLSLESSEHFSGVSPTFVGDVAVGAQAPYTLQVRATGITNGTYPLTLIISYKDDFGIVSSVRQTVQVEFIFKPVASTGQAGTTQPAAGGFGPMAIVSIIASLVVGFGLGYLVFGRKKEVVE